MDGLIVCLLSICAVLAVFTLMATYNLLYDLNNTLKKGITIEIKDRKRLETFDSFELEDSEG